MPIFDSNKIAFDNDHQPAGGSFHDAGAVVFDGADKRVFFKPVPVAGGMKQVLGIASESDKAARAEVDYLVKPETLRKTFVPVPALAVSQVVQGVGGKVRQVGDVVGSEGLSTWGDEFAEMGAGVEKTIQEAEPLEQGSWANSIRGGATSMYQQLPSMVVGGPLVKAGMKAVGLAASLVPMGAVTGGQSYQKLRERGFDVGEASAGSAVDELIEVGTELLPMNTALSFATSKAKFGLKQLAATALKFNASEYFGETLAAMGQGINDKYLSDPKLTPEQRQQKVDDYFSVVNPETGNTQAYDDFTEAMRATTAQNVMMMGLGGAAQRVSRGSGQQQPSGMAPQQAPVAGVDPQVVPVEPVAQRHESFDDIEDMPVPSGPLQKAAEKAPVVEAAPVAIAADPAARVATEQDLAELPQAREWAARQMDGGNKSVWLQPGESQKEYSWRILDTYREMNQPRTFEDSAPVAAQPTELDLAIQHNKKLWQAGQRGLMQNTGTSEAQFKASLLQQYRSAMEAQNGVDDQVPELSGASEVDGLGVAVSEVQGPVVGAGSNYTQPEGGVTNGLSEVQQEGGKGQEEVSDVRGEAVGRLGAGTTPLDAQAHEAASSPVNDLAEPTQAQIEAGNYKKGHVNLYGLDISIENPAGSVRKGVDPNGKAWETKLESHYGYIKGTVGKDKDHVDVFIKPGIDQTTAGDQLFVVDQIDPKTGKLDEHKVMVGFDSLDAARAGYLANYDTSGSSRIGDITETSADEFKQWLKDGDTNKAYAPRVVTVTTPRSPVTSPRRLDSSTDSLIVAVAKLGGIDRDQIDKQMGNGKELARTLNSLAGKEAKTFLYVISTKGMPLDRMREALVEQGYLREDSSVNDLLNRLDDAQRGTSSYSTANSGAAADKAYDAELSRLQEMMDSMTEEELAEFTRNQWLEEQAELLADASDLLDEYLDGVDQDDMTAADWRAIENDLKEALDATEFRTEGDSAADQGKVQEDAAGTKEGVSAVGEGDGDGEGEAEVGGKEGEQVGDGKAVIPANAVERFGVAAWEATDKNVREIPPNASPVKSVGDSVYYAGGAWTILHAGRDGVTLGLGQQRRHYKDPQAWMRSFDAKLEGDDFQEKKPVADIHIITLPKNYADALAGKFPENVKSALRAFDPEKGWDLDGNRLTFDLNKRDNIWKTINRSITGAGLNSQNKNLAGVAKQLMAYKPGGVTGAPEPAVEVAKQSKPADASSKATSTAPEHGYTGGVTDKELAEIVKEFNDAQLAVTSDEEVVSHIFDAPKPREVVRLMDKARIYHAKHGWMTPAEAKARIQEWKEHTKAQGDTGTNSDKVVLSLFDLSGQWSQPWEDAGYQVYRFDIQDDPEVGDVHNFSTEFFNDWFGGFDGMDIYAILAATPCTDFAVSGARHFAAKDADGRTISSVKLVHQTLATIEYFKPAVWAIENPVGRIEKLGGLPPWRLSFDPNHFGDTYTKKTLLWGRFNGDMPIAPVEPVEGSKMHSQYGGKSLATKNARSVTPEGFAYSFFMANNAIDHPVMAIANKYDRLDRGVIQQAVDAGLTDKDIDNLVEDYYYQELDDQGAEQALRDAITKVEVGVSTADLLDAFTVTESMPADVLGGATAQEIVREKSGVPVEWAYELHENAADGYRRILNNSIYGKPEVVIEPDGSATYRVDMGPVSVKEAREKIDQNLQLGTKTKTHVISEGGKVVAELRGMTLPEVTTLAKLNLPEYVSADWRVREALQRINQAETWLYNNPKYKPTSAEELRARRELGVDRLTPKNKTRIAQYLNHTSGYRRTIERHKQIILDRANDLAKPMSMTRLSERQQRMVEIMTKLETFRTAADGELSETQRRAMLQKIDNLMTEYQALDEQENPRPKAAVKPQQEKPEKVMPAPPKERPAISPLPEPITDGEVNIGDTVRDKENGNIYKVISANEFGGSRFVTVHTRSKSMNDALDLDEFEERFGVKLADQGDWGAAKNELYEQFQRAGYRLFERKNTNSFDVYQDDKILASFADQKEASEWLDERMREQVAESEQDALDNMGADPARISEVVSSFGEVQDKLFPTPPTFGKKSQGGKAASTGDLVDNFTATESVQPLLVSDESPAILTDFGEKLGGAKKDRQPSLDTELSDDDIVKKPLSEIWPKKELDAIEDVFIAAVATAARAEVPTKPQKGYKLARWVKTVKTVRELARLVQDMPREEFFSKAAAYRLEGFTAKVNLMTELDRSTWGRIGRVAEYPDAYGYEKDGTKRSSPFVEIKIDDKHHQFRIASIQEALPQIKELLGQDVAEKKMQFEVRGRGNRWAVNKKGDPLYRPLKTFTGDSKEAVAFVRDAANYDVLVKAWDEVKERENVKETDTRGKENRPRQGSDHRNGKDATPEMFMDSFGYRGVEFGLWVKQGGSKSDRQGMLNAAYDALMDLSAILKVPPKALSLNGTLGLGFGSRGSGWASAHYEPDTLVINLTKTRGAGALAHELFHAFDNYFAHQNNGGKVDFTGNQEEYRRSNYITYQPEPYYTNGSQKLSISRYNEFLQNKAIRKPETWKKVEGHMRPEVSEAFADLVKALDDSPMAKRSALLDKGKSGGYWSRIIERAARAFENYIIHKMQVQGYHNDYLANVTSEHEFVRDLERYPYLMESELQPVAEAFDNLFATIKTKETDKGVAMYSIPRTTMQGDSGLGDVTVAPAKSLPFIRKALAQENAEQVTVKGGNVDALKRVAAGFGKTIVFFRMRDAASVRMEGFEDEGLRLLTGRTGVDAVGGGDGQGAAIPKSDAGAGASIDGFVNPANPNVVFLNVESSNHLLYITGHELNHTIRMQDPALWDQMAKELQPLVKNWSQFKKAMPAAYDSLSESDKMEELFADVMGNHFLNDMFWQDMAQENAGLFTKIARKAVQLINKALRLLTGYDVRAYISDLEQSRAIIAKTLMKYGENVSKEQYGRYAEQQDLEYLNKRLQGQSILNHLRSIGIPDEKLNALFGVEPKAKPVVQTETPAFKKWFGDSKVVDENGKPLVVYHGTRGDFNAFRKGIFDGPMFFSESPDFASDFAGEVNIADKFVPESMKKGRPSVMPVYLKAEKIFNPMDEGMVDALVQKFPLGEGSYPTPAKLKKGMMAGEWQAVEALLIRDEIKALGYDGMIVYESLNDGPPAKNYAVFSPEQIKSATGNNGDFDGSNPDIRMAAAWHGSPHDFEQFSLSAIGTGEGAQVYGHGLYFAGNKEVAEYYRDTLSGNDKHSALSVDGESVSFYMKDQASKRALTALFGNRGDIEKTVKELAKKAESSALGGLRNQSKTAAEFLREFSKDHDIKFDAKGSLYQVELAPKEDEYLLWDKPLSEQSEKVKAALKKGSWLVVDDETPQQVKISGLDWMARSIIPDGDKLHIGDVPGYDGGQLYQTINRITKNQKAASDFLHSLGIRGIKYLDGNSRNRSIKDIKKAFLAELEEDAGFDDVMDLVGTGKFSVEQEALLKALEADEWLGFDYPAQAISAALGNNLNNFDPSQKLIDAVSQLAKDQQFNYVIFNDADVSIQAKYSIRRDTQKVSTVSTLEKIKNFLNPLDYSRFKDSAVDHLPNDATMWLADNLGNPYWVKESNPGAAPFYEEAKDREVTKLDNNIRMFGGLVANDGTRTAWDKVKGMGNWSEHTTAWGKLRKEKYDKLTDKQKAAYDVIRFEGDAYNKTYETLSNALRNPRIKQAGVDAQVFSFYREALAAEEASFEEKLQIAAENMAEAGIDPEKIKGHIAEYRARYADLKGWVHRDHGEGDHVVRVYHTIDRLDFAVDEVQHKGAAADRIRLPYFPGVELSRAIEKITTELGGTFKQLRDGGMVILLQKGQGEFTLERFDRLQLTNKAGKHKYQVLVFNRFVSNAAQARKLAAEVKSNPAAAMPRNYYEGHSYDTSWNFSNKLQEADFQELRTSDMKMEQVLSQAIDKAARKEGLNQTAVESIHEALVQNVAEALLGRGAGLYQIRRANYLIEGYDQAGSVKMYEDYINGVAGMFSKARYALRQFQNMKSVEPKLRNWATRYVADSLRNMGAADRMSGNVRAVVSLWYLGFNASWMLVNSTQPLVLGQAELSRYTKSPFLRIAKAEKDILTGKLTEDEKSILLEQATITQDRDSMMAEMTGSLEGVGGKASKALHGTVQVAMALGQKVEVLNRHTMIIAAYRVMRSERNMGRSEAYAQALEINTAVNIDMGRYNLPAWARGPVGRTFYSLQSYIQHMLNYLYHRSSSGDRADQKAVLRLLFAMFLLGGAPVGAPGSDELDKLIQRMFGYSPKLALKGWTRKMAAEYDTVGEMLDAFVWHGLPAVFKPFGVGISLTGATQLRLPIISNMIAGDDMTRSLTGPVGGLVQKGITAATALKRGDALRAAEYLAPTVVGNVLSAVRQSTKGVRTGHGKTVEYKGKPLKMELQEAVLRAVGLQPVRTADISETRGKEFGLSAEWRERRQEALDNYRNSRKLKYIAEFNQELRGSQANGIINPITADTLKNLYGKPDKKKAAWQQRYGAE